MKRLASTAALAAALSLGAITATPASAAPMPVLLHDGHSNLAICGNPGPCRPALKLYDQRGNLIIVCGDDCYFVSVLRDRRGWYVYLIGGPRTGPMAKKP